MNDNAFRIQYRFAFADGDGAVFDLDLDSETLALCNPVPQDPPDWTRIDCHRCPNCSLVATHCPVALHLVGVEERFGHLVSHDTVRVAITTPERRIELDTTVQKAVSSLLGLIIASSGCPHALRFRPMARHHLPFASEDETAYRAASMYLLAQYFLAQGGDTPDWSLDGLARMYQQLQAVNVALARRLLQASREDAMVNAVVILDMYARMLPLRIADSLSQLRPLFAAYGAAPAP